MAGESAPPSLRRLTTPHSAALAGIAFLWFLGVLRDRLGDLEDRFFATVFYGSGLLFLAMYFLAMAIAGGLVASGAAGAPAYPEDVIRFGQSVMGLTITTFALKMAGTFMISLGTMWLRTGLMSRWLAVLTYLGAAVLLVVVGHNRFIVLLFPAWVLLVSLVHLQRARRGTATEPG